MQDKQAKVLRRVLGMVGTNCYFVVNEKNNEAFIVDPADCPEIIKATIEEKNMIPRAILLTHGHFDHIMAVETIKEEYHIPVIASQSEKELLQDSNYNLSSNYGAGITVDADLYVKDQEFIQYAGFDIRVIHTPGHTKGGVCYYVEKENILFSGDTLFRESVGRTDFPTGNTSLLLKSIKEKLFILPEETEVFPGHGESTTILYEKKYNSFVR